MLATDRKDTELKGGEPDGVHLSPHASLRRQISTAPQRPHRQPCEKCSQAPLSCLRSRVPVTVGDLGQASVEE